MRSRKRMRCGATQSRRRRKCWLAGPRSKFSIYEGRCSRGRHEGLARMFAGAGAATALLKPIRDRADEYRQYPSRFRVSWCPTWRRGCA